MSRGEDRADGKIRLRERGNSATMLTDIFNVRPLARAGMRSYAMSKMRLRSIGSSGDVSVLRDDTLIGSRSLGTGARTGERSRARAQRGFGGDPLSRSASTRRRFRPACARSFGRLFGARALGPSAVAGAAAGARAGHSRATRRRGGIRTPDRGTAARESGERAAPGHRGDSGGAPAAPR